jgi:hypothetical protein
MKLLIMQFSSSSHHFLPPRYRLDHCQVQFQLLVHQLKWTNKILETTLIFDTPWLPNKKLWGNKWIGYSNTWFFVLLIFPYITGMQSCISYSVTAQGEKTHSTWKSVTPSFMLHAARKHSTVYVNVKYELQAVIITRCSREQVCVLQDILYNHQI